MNAAAEAVMKELPDLVLAYGNSDEFRYVWTFHLELERGRYAGALAIECWKPLIGTYRGGGGDWSIHSLADVCCSFVFHKDCALFERRARYVSCLIRAAISCRCLPYTTLKQ
jgi:hypothetical protein